MRLLSWQELIGRFGWHRGVPRRRDRQRDDFARLSLRRLEDRRVLNGAPMGMGVTVSDAQGALVVDATQSGGQAQTFSLTTFSKDGMTAYIGTDWKERVDAALAQAAPQTLSKLSRLSRRLRRPLAREAVGRPSRRRRGGSDS